MVTNKRKKNTRQRGSRTYGWGLTHRGKGNKGGAGNAGTGKRAKCKMPGSGLWHIQKFGKHGFKYSGAKIAQISINIRDIGDKLNSWLGKKKISLENNIYIIDLPALGFDKLLSTGKPIHKLKISVHIATKKAVEKIKTAGGEVILPKKKEKVAENIEEKA